MGLPGSRLQLWPLIHFYSWGSANTSDRSAEEPGYPLLPPMSWAPPSDWLALDQNSTYHHWLDLTEITEHTFTVLSSPESIRKQQRFLSLSVLFVMKKKRKNYIFIVSLRSIGDIRSLIGPLDGGIRVYHVACAQQITQNKKSNWVFWSLFLKSFPLFSCSYVFGPVDLELWWKCMHIQVFETSAFLGVFFLLKSK